MIPFIQNVQRRHIYRDKKQISDCLGMGQERGNREWLLMGMEFLLGGMEILKLDCGDSYTILNILTTIDCTL